MQTRQQCEASIRLKGEIDRITTWIAKLIRDGTDQGGDGVANSGGESDASESNEHRALHLSWACLVVGCATAADGAKATNRAAGTLDSFRVVAAACLLRELNDLRNNTFEKEFSALNATGSGKGYFSLRGG